jgi:hypothetical protein
MYENSRIFCTSKMYKISSMNDRDVLFFLQKKAEIYRTSQALYFFTVPRHELTFPKNQ